MSDGTYKGDSLEDNDNLARKPELEAKIRRRVACEERAHRIVEKLLDNPISESYLKDSGQFITPSHYGDIVDERVIIKQCGYPVCNSVLGNISKQKYHISTRSNKVYDISERKNFCSNQCFQASKYFGKQISSTPVWLRETEPPVQFTLLQTDRISGSLGTEVVGSKVPPELKNDLDLLRKLDEEEKKEALPNSGMQLSENATDENNQTSVVDEKPEKSKNVEDILTVSNSVENITLEEPQKHVGHDNVAMHSEKVSWKDSEVNLLSEKGEGSNANFLPLKVDKKVQKERTQKPESKTDYLMELLSKRKNLLRKMVDIQQPHYVEAEKVDLVTRELSFGIAESGPDSACDELLQEKPSSNQKEILDSDGMSESKLRSSPVIAVADSPKDMILKQVDLHATSRSKFHQLFPTVAQPLTNVCHRLSEWITIDTLKYLGLCSIALHTENGSESRSNNSKQKYAPLGEQLDAELELSAEIDLDGAPGLSRQPNMPVPDIEELKKKTTDFTLKVREYYKGTYSYSTPSPEPEDKQQPGKSTDEDGDRRVPVLPPVDSCSQGVIRCKIVLQRLDKSIPDLLTPLSLSIQYVATELRELVTTFSLGSKNITFRPGEWTLVALFLLKMLGKKVAIVRESFQEQKAINFLRILLKPLACSPTELEQMLSLLLETPLQETNSPTGS